MSPQWTIYRRAIDDWQDEEMLNDCFAELIGDSLTRGPRFLNFLLNGLVKFGNGAKVIATDRDPLPYRSDADRTRKIDFTVADDSKIVGFESKRRDTLTEGQLSDEREKLAYNADGREVVLVAITNQLAEPAIISELPDDVHWVSWYALSQQVFDADTLDRSWQPTVSRTKKMFREFGYTGFDGINDEEFRVSVWELWKQIATQVEGIDTGVRWPHRTAKKVDAGGWKPIDPDWMLLTYRDGNSGEHGETCLAVLSNKRTRTVRVGLAVRPWGDESLQQVLLNNAEILAERVLEEDLEVVQFPLNWLVGRKNLPKDHKKAVSAEFPTSRKELAEAFTDETGMKDDGANRFMLGYRLSSEDVVQESVEYIHRLQDLFNGDDEPQLRRLVEADTQSS